MQKVFLGIDTSCYTTSVALLNEEGQLVGEARQLLQVKAGRCGLQQSEMVFQHTRNLPRLIEEAFSQCDVTLGANAYKLVAIGASATPRSQKDSYMPAFLVGWGLARSLAAVHRVPLIKLSHQENHTEAGLWSAGGPKVQRFLTLHASGGTTDLLLAEQEEEGRYRLTQVGGSIDLHAGQFIDRIGVALGLQFPTGPALEALAETATTMVELPVAVRKLEASLSGPATAAQRLLAQGADPAALALGVEHALAETFLRLFRRAAEQYQVQHVLLVGGVGSNKYIRAHLEKGLAKRRIKLYVPEAKYSCDNAAGCAALAQRLWQRI